MRKILVLICVLFFVAGCGDQYPAEKLYWKANKFSEDIFRNPKGTPLSQYEEAVNAWDKFLGRHPLDGRSRQIMFVYGQLRYYQAAETEKAGGQGEYKKAVSEWEKLVNKYPNTEESSLALFRIGRIYEEKLVDLVVRKTLGEVWLDDPIRLLSTFVLDEEAVRSFAARAPIQTDDYPYVKFDRLFYSFNVAVHITQRLMADRTSVLPYVDISREDILASG